MRTNKISVTFSMKNIDEDFDIYKVEKSEKDYYENNILDSALYEFKAVSVQWTFGATALVMFRKGEVTERQFKDNIMQEYKDVKIQKIDIFDSDQCKCFQYQNRLLAQLLINSMRTPKHDAFMYHNLTGSLFYHDPSWKHKDKLTGEIKFIRFLKVVIDPGMYLNLDTKTFKCFNRKGSGLHVIDPKTGVFRKKLKTDVNLDTYIKRSRSHKRFHIDNFDMTDYEHFRKTKLGVMEQFLRDVEEKLSRYLTITILESEDAQTFDISSLEKTDISEREYGELLLKKGVRIVDEVDTEKSNKMVELLKTELLNYYGVEVSVGTLSLDEYNIRIIHNQEFYVENELHDPHSDNLKGYIVQHMTEEAEHFTDSKGSSPAVKKIEQELIIKGDVREGKISIFDWQRLDSGKDWTFICREKRETENKENTEHKNFAGKKVKKYFDYYRLQIDGSGGLKFDSFYDGDDNVPEEWRKICYEYDSMEKKHFGIGNCVEGLYYSDIDNIHAILRTREKTLPNIAAFMDTLKETDVKQKVQKETLLQAIKDFELVYPDYAENALEWGRKLEGAAEMITKKEIKKILNMRTNAASLFNRFLHEKYEIWIDGEMRKKEFEATYQISNLLNIQYKYNENDYEDGQAFKYYVGAKSKRLSYPNACCMRKVVSSGGSLEFEEMLPLMAVEFVRNSQYTVIPFPYKYLREYQEQC